MADELFKATEKDWDEIKRFSCNTHPGLFYVDKTILELRDRVAALEAAPDRVFVRNQTGEYVKPWTPIYADPLVSWSLGTAKPIEECGKDHVQVPPTTAPTPPAAVPSGDELFRIWYDAPGGTKESLRVVWDHGFQHGLAAGRAEQCGTPEPEPSQAPAGNGGLVEGIRGLLGHQFDRVATNTMARAVLLAVAKWLRSEGYSYYVAAELEREARR
jgi:hypothetical protein